jgi:hypothetical protein
MALTMDQLQKLLKAQDFKYFLHPEKPALMVGATGTNGSYQFLIALENEGQFLQFRTLRYLFCKADDPHLAVAMKVIGHLNYMVRMAKWGWDPRDGEIDVCADVWIMDGTLTTEQFKRVLFNYLAAIDLNHPRLKQAVESGTDPGEVDPMSTLPPELRDLMERLRRAAERQGEEEEEGEFSKI